MQINELAEHLLAQSVDSRRIILVLGGCDTGKTTFTLNLAKRLVHHTSISIVDADTGQSHIGPPSVIASAPASPDTREYEHLTPNAPAFTGDVTPSGHLLQFCVGLQRCTKAATQSAQTVLIDTPGYIVDSTARALWHETCRLIEPDLIIALQKENELAHILKGLPKKSQVRQISVSSHIPPKTVAERQAYRRNCFRKYFSNASEITIELTEIPWQSRLNLTPENTIRRIAAVRNYAGFDTALGIVTDVNPHTGQLKMLTPAKPYNDMACIVFGDFIIENSVVR